MLSRDRYIQIGSNIEHVIIRYFFVAHLWIEAAMPECSDIT